MMPKRNGVNDWTRNQHLLSKLFWIKLRRIVENQRQFSRVSFLYTAQSILMYVSIFRLMEINVSSSLDEQLIIIVEDLFFGGLVTTGTLLTWSILFLVLNPDVQVKLRREILGKMQNPTDSMQAIELKKYNFRAERYPLLPNALNIDSLMFQDAVRESNSVRNSPCGKYCSHSTAKVSDRRCEN